MQNLTRFKVTVTDYIAQVVINNPSRANALDLTAWQELKTIFETLDTDVHTRCIILMGEGKHFCSGIDIQVLMNLQQTVQMSCEGRKREKIRRFILDLQACISAIEKCSKPVLAAIQGSCIGGGLDIVAACDIRYSTEDATFCLKEVDMGLVADLGVLQRLPAIIPASYVREMALTARNITGKQALQMGLVTATFTDVTTLWEGIKVTAIQIASKSPLTVRGIKEVMNYSQNHTIEDGLNYVATWNSAMILSNDLQEAVMSAIEKRKAQFE